MKNNQAFSNVVMKIAREQWKHESKHLVEINMAVMLLVLHDKFGFGEKRAKELMKLFRKQCEAFYNEKKDGNQVDMQELFEIIKNDLKIDIEEELNEEY